MTRTIAPMWLMLGAFGLACTAPNVTATIKDEPVCPDFKVGAAGTLMKGGLRKPVIVSVLEDEDDEDALSARTLLGRRTPESPTPPVIVQDANETFWIRWAQCSAERAPRAVKSEARGADQIAAYQCGEAKAYTKEALKVRKGDASSRVITFKPPPDPACWTDTVPEGASPETPEKPE